MMQGAIGLALGWGRLPAGDLVVLTARAVAVYEGRRSASAVRRWFGARASAADAAGADVAPGGQPAVPVAGCVPAAETAAPTSGAASGVPSRTPGAPARSAAGRRWGLMLVLLGVALVLIGTSRPGPAASRA